MEIDGHFTKRRQEKHVMEVEIFKEEDELDVDDGEELDEADI